MHLGKRVADELYVHRSAVHQLVDLGHKRRIEEAFLALTDCRDFPPNVAKLNLRTGRLSLLSYRAFDEDPFPELQASWVFQLGSAQPDSYRTYTDSLNPPILHRKELLTAPGYPNRDEWMRLTQAGEKLGLFDDTTAIGFKLNWECLIAKKGYQLSARQFVPIANEVPPEECSSISQRGRIQRHRTALARSVLSAPVQLLLRHGLLAQGTTFFDYGCGRGTDIEGLNLEGFTASGWDPHYAPTATISPADVVNLGFVVNVIEDPVERVDAIQSAFALARDVLSIGVMLYSADPPGRPYLDGFITSRNTFQKYFSQSEFKDYVEQTLDHEPFMVGPGVAFIFADEEAEQRFLSSRYRAGDIARRLLGLRSSKRRDVAPLTGRISKRQTDEDNIERNRSTVDALWTQTLELGRLPEPDEVRNLPEVEAKIGNLAKAHRLLIGHYDQRRLAEAAAIRADDLRLYFATLTFSRRQSYKNLEPRIQRDVKAFFGTYQSAQAAGLELLLHAANTETIHEACKRASAMGLGWLDGQHSLQVHVSLIERLPVILRAYVACGLLLCESLSDVQLVKIHIQSGKLTLLEFDDFDQSPIPKLRRRIKVNLRRQNYQVFEYGTNEYPKQILYHKSRYLHEDYEGYAEQLAFDEVLELTGIFDEFDAGPSVDTLNHELEIRRLQIEGGRIGRSERIPDLDQPCGRNFTYRELIECGETQKRLHLPNLPRNPQSFTALYDLVINIVDPVIEYFGSIELTYGFSSPELSSKIIKGIAPRLDQHAAHELNRSNKLICKRGGAACDFIVVDEDMLEVARWIVKNTAFDRLYYYGANRPLHVSYSTAPSGQAYQLSLSKAGRLIPTRMAL